MLTIRLVEDELQRLCLTGEASDLHFSKGQEAISVGVCSELRPTDYIVTHHRTISPAIARGFAMNPFMAEILGKATGINKGLAGEMHIRNPDLRFMFSFQLVGTCASVAAGLAWAVKHFKKEDAIVVVFLGDAATSNAQFHEGMNLAAVQEVPLLVIVEDNHLAGNIRPEFYLPAPIEKRFESFGIPASKADGNKVDEVMKAARAVIAEVRASGSPAALILDTTRLSWHKQGQRDVRSQAELNRLAKRDPLLYEEKRLGIDEATKAKLTKSIEKEIAGAVAYARASPIPKMPKAEA
jgi:acetoin:2,6-dichlorophenolindophenol oxidoreductase subunit alpha